MMKKNKIFISFLIALAIAGISIVPAFAADLTDIYNQVVLIRSNLNDYYTGSQGLLNQVQTINSRLYQYLPSLNDIKSSVSSIDTRVGNISTMLNNMNNNLVDIDSNTDGIESALGTSNSWLSNINSNLITNTNQVINSNTFLSNIAYDTRQLQEVLANATDAAIRNDYEDRLVEVNNDFLSSSGDASVSLGDIGSSKQSVNALKNSLSGGASASSLWSVLTSGSEGWGWFSQATMNNLDQTGSGSRRSAPEYEYLNDYYAQVMNSLGGEYND